MRDVWDTPIPAPPERDDIDGEPVPVYDDEFSREAAESIRGEIAKNKRQRVFDVIKAKGPIACWEVERELGGLHQSVSASINYLKRRGFVVVQGENVTPSGRRAGMYIVPAVRIQGEIDW